jgi:hypothetical protein
MGLGTAIRMMVGQYLDDVDARQDLSRAEEWQRARAWETAQETQRRRVPEATLADLRNDERLALDRVGRRGNRSR